ncbi:MAG TPA: secretin N-terminal domain-containing protein [Nitrospira sp.]|nr:secretin N-terminal domain-containing protein [Nitrospira sp.]
MTRGQRGVFFGRSSGIAQIAGVCLLSGCALFASPDAKRGDQHLAAGHWEEASLAYKQALKEAPFDASLQGKYVLARERAGALYEERGRALLKDRQIDLAVEQFKQALAMDPSRTEYQASLAEAVRLKEARTQYREADRLAQLGRRDEAFEGFTRSAELDPTFQEPLDSLSRMAEEQQALQRGDRLKQPLTLKFRNAGLKEVLEGVAKAGGFTLIFDKDVRNDPISIAIQDTTVEDALQLVLNSNSLFSQKVSPSLLIVSPNTKQKQEQYQDLMIRTFYLSNAKSKDMLVLLKTMLDSKRMHANEQLNTIVIRDQPEKIQMAERIILANDRQEAEVLFDVEVLEVNRTINQNYGLTYPKQVAAAMVPLPPPAGLIAGTIAQQFSASQLSDLGPGNYLFKLPTNVQLDFFKQITDAKTLASPKIRVVNNKKAEINIGDKQPILLSTTNVLPGQATTGAVPTTSTVTSIEFRDTGVKLTVEPAIKLGNELGLKMKIEVIRLGEQVTLQASPPITQFKFGNRSAETMLSIKDGETIVLGGLLQEEDRKTRVTVPWIGDLPLIGNLISSFRTDRVTTEVILTITPHIVQNMTPPALSTQTFWSGTESTYATNPLFSSSAHTGGTALRNGLRETSLSSSNKVGGLEEAKSSRLFEQMAAPDPLLTIRPEESAIRSGKEIKLAVVDARIAASDAVFRLEYDPNVLEFKRLSEAEMISAPEAQSDESVGGAVGTISFRLSRPTQRAPRTANVTFMAKARGVSPVRVELVTPGRDSQAMTSPVGTGIVRVR